MWCGRWEDAFVLIANTEIITNNLCKVGGFREQFFKGSVLIGFKHKVPFKGNLRTLLSLKPHTSDRAAGF